MAALYWVQPGVTLRKEHARFVVEAPQSNGAIAGVWQADEFAAVVAAAPSQTAGGRG